ncbi:MAG: PAS domain-containing sensor histidine kinase [Rhodospirillales bacterium]
MQGTEIISASTSWRVLLAVESLLIIIAVAGTFVAFRRFKELRRAGATLGVVLILAGLWAGILLYSADLYVTGGRPEAEALVQALAAAAPLGSTVSWFVIAASAALVLAGLVITVLRMVHQTTVLDRQRQALEDSESILQSVFDNVPVALLIKDGEHIIERPNRTYMEWYGFDMETMVGRRSDEIEDFQSSQEATFMNRQEELVLRSGRTLSRQVERKCVNGELRILNITKFPIYDRSGTITKVGSVSVDLTEQVTAQKKLAESEARFRDFAEVASDWLWEMDEDLRFCYFSRRTGEITGFDPSINIGLRRSDIAGMSVDQVKWSKHLDDLERHQPFRDFEYQFKDREGELRTARISGKPLFDERGRFAGYRGTGTDVTEQRLVQQSRDKALRAAEQANRAKSEFLAAMSHELRTPLNAILGFSDILANDYLAAPLAEKRQEYARDIHDSAGHLLDLVNDLLDISAIEAGKLEVSLAPESLSDIVEDCANTMAEVVRGKGIELEIRVPDGLPHFPVDRRAIKQTLLNLLSNAVKFTGRDGRISVTVEQLADAQRIKVSDTGIGIPTERLDEIAKPFSGGPQSPYSSEKGWGLGLAISRSLVELHGGSIEITSELGQGTTVIIVLPQQEQAISLA